MSAYERYVDGLYRKRCNEKINSETYMKYMRKLGEWDRIAEQKGLI